MIEFGHENSILPSEVNNALAVAAKNDPKAMEQLIKHNSKLIMKTVNTLKKRTTVSIFEELFQEGVLGVHRACQTYEISKGAFTTYAYPWIRHYMLNCIREMEPFHYQAGFYSLLSKSESITQYEDDPELYEEELKKRFNNEDVQKIKKYRRKITSLDFIKQLNDDNEFLSKPDPEADPEYLICEQNKNEILVSEMRRILSERDFTVLSLYYGIGYREGFSIHKIPVILAKATNTRPLSYQAIQQIIKRSEQKLRRSEKLRALRSPA